MKGTKAILRVLSDPTRKSLPVVLKEITAFCLLNREGPTRYVNNLLYRKEAGDPLKYISKREAKRIHKYQRDAAIGQFFGNKILSYLHLQNTDVRLPRLMGYNVGGHFTSPEGRRSILLVEEFRDLLEDMLEQYSSVFMKPATGAGGGGIIEFSSKGLDQLDIHKIHRRVIATSNIFQERIRQHPDIDLIYARSVNTMRVMTCLREGKAEVISAVMRFGTRGNHIDNASSGGIFIGVDLSSGKLMPPARQYLRSGGGLFMTHPDTDYPFKDFTVPCFEEVKEMALKANRTLPYKIVGWDIAVSDEGPVIVEANDWPNFDLVDVSYGGYKAHPTFGPYLKEILSVA